MGTGWSRVDRAVHGGAHNLTGRDQCYFYMDRQRGGWDKSEANQLIFNFKKRLKRRGCPDWHYKTEAIEKFSDDVARLLGRFAWRGRRPVLVPMPTSKCRSDDAYDDRIVRVAQKASEKSGIDYHEVFDLGDTMVSAHFGGTRSVGVIQDNLILMDGAYRLCDYDVCLLVDDVLTTGAHFRACKEVLQNEYPQMIVIGVFWSKQLPDEYDYGVSVF